MSNTIKFVVEKKDKPSSARAGILSTPHGIVHTPMVLPVGTNATVKTLSSQDLASIGVEIFIANAYHLHLRPGEDVIAKMGGLGKFMSWSGVTMTDSGGFQVFSLGSAQRSKGKKLSKFTNSVFIDATEGEKQTSFIKKVVNQSFTERIKPASIDEDGVTFYSHLDGSKHRLDPRISIQIQEKLGADIIVGFDDHESPLWGYEETKASLERNNRWLLESKKFHKRKDQLMYGVVHGGMFEDLRVSSAKFVNKHFEAIAIGGSYSSKKRLYTVIDWTIPYFDKEKPRHLLGIAEIADLFEAVERGMDLFDCVAATRRARHGNLYVAPQAGGSAKQNFTLSIVNAKFVMDPEPIDKTCLCMVCQTYSRSYISHLYKADEMLGKRLGTYHNVFFITNLAKKIRQAILEDRFDKLKREWLG